MKLYRLHFILIHTKYHVPLGTSFKETCLEQKDP